MTKPNYADVAIATAGMLQAVTLLCNLSQYGKMDELAFETSLKSILIVDPKDTRDVYKDLKGLKTGLYEVINIFNYLILSDTLQSRYLDAFLQLQKKISKNPKIIQTLSERLDTAQKQAQFFSLMHPLVLSNLSDAYLQAVHEFKFKLIIYGNQRFIQAHETIIKIRVLLLAGIRAAVLWRQVGGTRLQFLLHKNEIVAATNQLLSENGAE